MKIKNPIVLILALAAIGALMWIFRTVILYIIIAALLTIITRPLELKLEKLRIAKKKIPRGIRALAILLGIYIIIGAIISIFIPMILTEINYLANVDQQQLMVTLKEPIDQLHSLFADFRQTSGDTRTFNQFVQDSFANFFGMTQISVVATTAMNTVISLISAFFIISFFTFFMLKDGTVIYETLLLAVPVKHRQKVQNILDDTTTMLNKYFTAILIDIIVVSILISIGMSILGIHNAITIGILAGILNVIPYVGPLIGAVVAMIIGISTNLHLEFYSGLLPLAGKTGLVFLIVNSIDAFLLQPYIFSNSVKAHPIEIFTVILLGATIAGIPGMIAAVPVYTVLRIVAKEFLSHYHFIKKLTDDLDEATEPEVQRDKDYPEL